MSGLARQPGAIRSWPGSKVVDMQVHESLIELFGNTPLVRLRKVTRGLRLEGAQGGKGAEGGRGAESGKGAGGGKGAEGGRMWRPPGLAKVEYFNPRGSVMD